MRADTTPRPAGGRSVCLDRRPRRLRARRLTVERLDERVLLSTTPTDPLTQAVSDAMRGPVTALGQDSDPLSERLTADLKAALAGRPVPLTVSATPGAGAAALRVTVAGDGVFAGAVGTQTLKGPWAGGVASLALSATAKGSGEGHLSAVVQAVRADGTVIDTGRADLYARYDAGRVWDSTSSFFDLDYNRLAALRDAGQIDQAAFAAGVQVLYGGAPGSSTLAPAPAGPRALAAPSAVTVSGNIQWTDGAGGKHGAPLVPVEVWESNGTPAADKKLTATPVTTDSSGHYTATVTPDAGFTNLYVRAYAKSTYCDVKAQTAGAKTYTMDSAPKPVSGATLTLDKVGSNAPAATNERAFAVETVMTLVGAYYSTLAGSALPALTTIFPQIPAPGKSPVSYFDSANKLMNVRDTAWNQPDVTEHEYGHYVASANHFGPSPGGSHSISSNNATQTRGGTPLGKGPGNQLAFSEGWATYFSISGQDASGAAALGIPTMGDHSYNGLVSYSLDTLAADGHATGEDNEGSVSGVLWNMYLTSKDPTSDLHYTDKSIFDLMTSAKPSKVGDVWEAAAAKLDTRGKTELGKIFSDMNIAPTPQEPADNVTFKPSDPIPTFKWKNNGGGTPNPLNEFKVVFYSDDFSKKVFESPVGEVTVGAATSSWKPTADEWKTITAGGPRLKWVVEGKNKSNPATPGGSLGYYWSPARTIGAPVGIAFVIDVTGSMGDEIASVRDALQQYINEVAAKVPKGTDPPTIELVSFRDAPSVEITSNDLAAVRNAVGGLFASGGGDCPEPSARALQVAVNDLGPGGTILLATDASSDPGIDLSAVIAAARAKGVTVNVILSGDCSGIGSAGGGASGGAMSATRATGDGGTDTDADCNGVTVTPMPAVKAIHPDPYTGPVAPPEPTGISYEGGSTADGEEPPQVPIDVTPGPAVTLTGHSLDTATRLTPGAAALRGLAGLAADQPDVYVMALQGGVRYGLVVSVDSGAAPLVEVLGTDGKTVLVSHQDFETLDSGQVLSTYTLAVDPPTTGDYYVRVTGTDTSDPSYYTLRVKADPLADVTSSIEGFSAVATQTGGAFDVRDDVKRSNGGNTAAYVAAMYNIMSSTLGPAVIVSNPGTAPQGQTVALTLTGRKTNWRAGVTSVSFSGTGLTVTGVTVTSPTTLTAVVQVAPDAAMDFRDVTVTSALGTGTETATGKSVVEIAGPVTSPTLLSVAANTLSRGQTADIVIRGALTSWDGSSTLTLGPGVAVKSFRVVSPTLINATVTVAPGADVGFRTATVTTTGHGTDSQPRALFVNSGSLAIPQVTAVSPATANTGQTIDVAITGSGTHFVDGRTTASFGAGVTVISVTVTDPTHATAHLTVAPGAAVGFRNVTVTTSAENAVLLNGFFVNNPPPPPPTEAITSVTPNKALQGQTIDVTIRGANTSWVNGTTSAAFGAGVTVVSTTVTGPTTLTARIVVAPNAAAGVRNVVVTTGSDVVTLAGGFVVNARPTPPPPTQRVTPSGYGIGYDAYVITLYREVLGRTPEPAALRFWSWALAVRRVPPVAVAVLIWNSPEHRLALARGTAPRIPLGRAYCDALHASCLALAGRWTYPLATATA